MKHKIEEHLKNKELSKELKAAEKHRAETHSSIRVASYDLQHMLANPQ